MRWPACRTSAARCWASATTCSPRRAPYQSSAADGEKGALLYTRDRGLTLRDDSILVQAGEKAYLSGWIAPYFWDALPVILESEHYGMSRDRRRTCMTG